MLLLLHFVPSDPCDEPHSLQVTLPPKWGRKPCAALAETFAESMIQGSTLSAAEIRLVHATKGKPYEELDKCTPIDELLCNGDKVLVLRRRDAPASSTATATEAKVIVATENKSAAAGLQTSRSTKAPPKASAYDIAKARELRARGNDAFKADQYVRAIELYRAAFEADSSEYVVLGNLAAAHQKLGEHAAACEAASRALEICGGAWPKAWLRRALASKDLRRFADATAAARAGLAAFDRGAEGGARTPDHRNEAELRKRLGAVLLGSERQRAACVAKCEEVCGALNAIGPSDDAATHVKRLLHVIDTVDPYDVECKQLAAIYFDGVGAKPELVCPLLEEAICEMQHADAGDDDMLRATPNRIPPKHLRALVHVNYADALLKRSRVDEALEHFAAAVVADPTGPLAYVRWGFALEGLGRRADALEIYERAVKAGVWDLACQRPVHYVRDLKARPWWDAARSRVCCALEAAFPTIRAEAAQLLSRDGRLRADGAPPPEPLAQRYAGERGVALFRPYASEALDAKAGGEWGDVGLFFNGARHDRNARLCPQTARVLEGLRDVVSMVKGSCYFSLLRPGTHLKAHCGPTNERLRVHLGLVVPREREKCWFRVNEETRFWEEGKCLWFDDSFEHEVWNQSEEDRLVLICDMWHPDLSDDEQRRPLCSPRQWDAYTRIVETGHFATTEESGH